MGGQPLPITSLLTPSDIPDKSTNRHVVVDWRRTENPEETGKKRPSDRRVIDQNISSSTVDFEEMQCNVLSHNELRHVQFKITELETKSHEVMQEEVMAYMFAKTAFSETEVLLPDIKTFFARQYSPDIEKSNKTYISIRDEHCDSDATLMNVLSEIYVKREVGVKRKYI